MRIAFIVHRTNFYRIYGPVIDAALKLGWIVECWLLHGEVGKKDYLVPTEKDLPRFYKKIVVRQFPSREDLSSEIRKQHIDALISLYPKSYYVGKESLRSFFVTLQNGIDTFVNSNLEQLLSSDQLALHSPYWAEWSARYYAASEGVGYQDALTSLEEKATYPGMPQMDLMKRIDPVLVRDKYGIQPGRPVLLLPITLSNKSGAWPRFFESESRKKQLSGLWKIAKNESWRSALTYWQWVLKGWNDQTLTEAIGEFCKRNDAILIAKGRSKDRFRQWLVNRADIAVYDESFYPPTALELLSVADVCIHFYSLAALESAYVGTFGITIDRPSPTAKLGEEAPLYHRLWRSNLVDSAFNYPKVNAWMTIPEAIRRLPKTDLDTLRVDETHRNAYVETYMGSKDNKASERLLDFVANRVNRNELKASSVTR